MALRDLSGLTGLTEVLTKANRNLDLVVVELREINSQRLAGLSDQIAELNKKVDSLMEQLERERTS